LKSRWYILFSFLLASPVLALNLLSVGQDISRKGWNQIRESARFVAVEADSIWMWNVEPNANLSDGIAERKGKVLFLTEDGLYRLREGEALFDGDGNTAIDPDSVETMGRMAPLFVDLGATFRVNRIRFFPRLDHTNRRRFLQEFSILTYDGSTTDPDSLYGSGYHSLFSYYTTNPNVEPVVDRRFSSRNVRFLQIVPSVEREWEIAEFEVYGDGTVPVGEFVSLPLRALKKDIIWGKVRYEGGSIEQAPVVVQTRTGPDGKPLHYFRRLPEGDLEIEQIDKADYLQLEEDEQGPIKPNPEWSTWETVTDGIVRSPGLRQYLQFKLRLATPGTVLKQLTFEYTEPPLARSLVAEISPDAVEGGVKTRFTLSMLVHLKTSGKPQDTGFRQIQVLTAAEIGEVEQVWVDDRRVYATFDREPGKGFTANLWQRVKQNGTFVQIVFWGTVFRDRTRFEVRALDRRTGDEGGEEAYQLFGEGDVDPALAGGDLVVKLEGEGGKVPLLTRMHGSALFTPNDDGVNDEFRLSYSLLKLMEPAAVTLEIYDLSGRLVRRAYRGMDVNGNYASTWDGRDEMGQRVPVGIYVYEVRVETDRKIQRRQGVIGVAY